MNNTRISLYINVSVIITQVSDFKFISTQKLMPGFSRKTYPILSIIQRLFVSSSKIPGALYRLTAVGRLSDTCQTTKSYIRLQRTFRDSIRYLQIK